MAGKRGHIFKLASTLSEFNALHKIMGTKQIKKLCTCLGHLLNQTMWADQINSEGWPKYLHI